MASYFNMKGTTQTTFMVGVQGPVLTKYVLDNGNTATTYLLLPANTIGTKIVLDQSDPTKYIDKTTYTGNAATATKLSSKNIGLSIRGLTIVHTKDDESSGLSDGSGDIYGYLSAIDSSKLALGANNDGVPYTVLAGLVVSGDLSTNNDSNKIASSNHTHDQYLSTSSFTLSTKDGETELGQIKINSESETYQVASQTALLNLNIRDASIVAANIATGAVTSAKIDTGAVLLSKIADNAIQPSKLKSIDVNNGYAADYTSKIAKVQAAHDLLDDGKIAGVNLSSIFVKDSQTNNYTAKVKSAEIADYASSLKVPGDGGATKSASDVISAVNTVTAASATQSTGNIVLWSDGGINGNASSASVADKLSNAGEFWGNKFDGSVNNETGTKRNIGTSLAAANIQYTGNITPHTTDVSSIGSVELKYNNLYLANTMNALNASITNKATVRLIEINKANTTLESERGIDLKDTTIRNASSVSVTSLLPYGNNSAIGASTTPFTKIYLDDDQHLWWKEDGADVNLHNALAGKAPTSHTHSINSLTDTQQYRTETDGEGHEVQVPLQFINHIAMEGHHHSLSEIDGIDGIYQFKGTIDSVATNEQNELVVTGVATPSHNGDVYNVLASFTYQNKTYPAGTNIVYETDMIGDPAAPTGRWKPLGGVFNIDLDNFITSVTQTQFRSAGLLDNDFTTWTAEASTNNAGKITTSLWYRAQNTDLHTSFDTYFPKATATSFGLAKLGYTVDESNRNYPVSIDNSGNLYTHVTWGSSDNIDTYGVVVARANTATTNDNVFESASNIERNIYFNLTHLNEIRYNGATNGTVTGPNVEKSIKIEGSGQVSVGYTTTNASPNNGTLTIDVPMRAGYSIPIIKCIDYPEIYVGEHADELRGNEICFNASTTTLTGNGVESENGLIKDNSLVLLYLEHANLIYQTHRGNRVILFVSIPAKYFYYETDTMDWIREMDENDMLTFLVQYTTKSLGPYVSNTTRNMDIADFSQKLFLCHIYHSEAEIDDFGQFGHHACGIINILDNIGATMNDLEPPMIHIEGSNSSDATNITLVHYNSNTMSHLLARYSGFARILVRTYKINDQNMYTPIFDLDQEVPSIGTRHTDTEKLDDYHEWLAAPAVTLYTKSELLDKLIYQPSLESGNINRILFKGDKFIQCPHPGITKTHGHISLKDFTKEKYIRYHQRDYSKLKFRYILEFNDKHIYDVMGKLSHDEILVTKRISQCYCDKYDRIKLSINKENDFHY